MAIIATGILLAKHVFAVHGVNRGVVRLHHPTVGRTKLLALIAALPPTVIGMEALLPAAARRSQTRFFGRVIDQG